MNLQVDVKLAFFMAAGGGVSRNWWSLLQTKFICISRDRGLFNYCQLSTTYVVLPVHKRITLDNLEDCPIIYWKLIFFFFFFSFISFQNLSRAVSFLTGKNSMCLKLMPTLCDLPASRVPV